MTKQYMKFSYCLTLDMTRLYLQTISQFCITN